MWVGIANIIPIISNLPGQGSAGPAPTICYIELESSTGSDYVELEPAASTDVMILENCGGAPITTNVTSQLGDTLITQTGETIIQQ